jgi:hypothetical protein
MVDPPTNDDEKTNEYVFMASLIEKMILKTIKLKS